MILSALSDYIASYDMVSSEQRIESRKEVVVT